MLIYSSQPVNMINNRIKIPLRVEDILDEDVYKDVWLPLDNKESDISHLINKDILAD